MASYNVKLCLLGNKDVGKTCIGMRYMENEFKELTTTTIGASFLSKTIKTEKGTNFKLNIWDTSGEERFRSITPFYYRGANVAILVYSITSRGTFTDIANDWVKLVKMYCRSSETILVLIGNKLDLEGFREVNEDEGRELAKQIGALFWETSAKTGQNIQTAFDDICKHLDENEKLNLTPVPDFVRERTLTVISNDGTQVEPRRSRIQCCH